MSVKAIARNLERIRGERRMSVEQLAKAVGVTRPTMYKYLRGEQPIDSAKLEKLCEALGVSVRQILSEEAEMFAFLFRADNPKENFTQELRHTLLERLDEYWSVVEALGENRVVMVPPSYRLEGELDHVMKAQIRDVADRVRSALGVEGYVGHLIFQMLEDWHIHVLAWPLGSGFDALSAYTERRGAFIIVNDDRDIPEERKIFSVAHELGHLLFHRDQYRENGGAYAKSRGNRDEMVASQFASHFLIPRSRLTECEMVLARSRNKLRDILQLKREFGVSAQALILALKDVGILTGREYGYLKREIEQRYGIREPNPMPYVEKNGRARMMLRRLHGEEGVSTSKAAAVLGIPYDEANRLLAGWEREDGAGDF
ncbi:MAG TPA: ImmA/IrrE family metallo-endopeptidase [Alicyclobacillus sp.]|nr:ImmA/IrrE family metallo-endopeptidase [Alicyclobacillus sp.]